METTLVVLIIVLIVIGLVIANVLIFVFVKLRDLDKKFETLFVAFANIGNGMGILNNNIIEMLKTCTFCNIYSNTVTKEEKPN